MNRIVVAALAAVVWIGCGDEGVARHANTQRIEAETPAADLYALGTSLTSNGAVPRDAVGEAFPRGSEVYLSVNVAGASTEQEIEVRWVDPHGKVIRKAQREVPKGSDYAAFSSGETGAWRPGPHRAVVVINGRKVSERAFDVM